MKMTPTMVALAEQLLQEPSLDHWTKSNKQIYDQIKTLTSFLRPQARLRERLWHIANQTETAPNCKMCPSKVKWNDHTRCHQLFCSVKCSKKDPDHKQKYKQTCIDKYGTPHPWANKDVRRSMQQTMLDRYGVTNPSHNESIRQKTISTNISKYGTECSLNNKEVQIKRANTLQQRHGVDHQMRSPAVKDKVKRSSQWAYKRNSIKRVGQSISDALEDVETLYRYHTQNKMTLVEIANKLGVTQPTISKLFKKHNLAVTLWCTSTQEQEIYDFLAANLPEDAIERNNKTLIAPYELDIVIPTRNIAIEYNGNYWHSELCGRKRSYHNHKTALCRRQGYHLIHVRQDQWVNRRDVVKSRLLSKLGIHSQKIGARHTEVRMVPPSQADQFFRDTHIQGSCNAAVTYGLFYHDRLVSAMSFGRSRFNKQYDFELLRFSTQLNTQVYGASTRLFKHFLRDYAPSTVVTYSDRSWNEGLVYEKMGFRYTHTSTPNYYYFHNDNALTLYHRWQFQKHKLSNKLDVFDPNLTEWANMLNNGYNRIWDCGNDVWVYHNDERE